MSKPYRIRLKEPIKVKCSKCGYEWFTRSTLQYLLCPRCHSSTKSPIYKDILKGLVQTV